MDNILLKQKSQIEIVKQIEQEKHYKLVGSIVIKPGLKLYSLNLQNSELKEVDIVKNKMINFQKQKVQNGKSMHDPKCSYFQALNQKNAEKKAVKIIKSILTF